MFAALLASVQSDADLARVVFLVGAVLAVIAAVFCVLHQSVESALGWGAVGLGLFAGWLLL